ncbi:hypothetical protein LCGC14_0387300 [marine sediment metagenome]|uniref:Uncharacterized protein n=1 Tax=marine sediment metagenome TaxID=412755 RepID=A0A0F9TIY9_9ZZZZ
MATTYARVISAKLFIDWDFDDAYTEETDYLIRADGSLRFHPPATGIWTGSGIVDRCTLTLDNSTGRFSPLNTGGALYGDIRDGKAYNAPMYIEVSINGGSNYYTVFAGVIKIPREMGSTSKETAIITIDCRSLEEPILSKLTTTTATNFIARHNLDYNEADYIANVLIDAGIGAGDQDMDAGTFCIPWMWIDQESPIETCWKLAAAGGGRFYYTPDGKYAYENSRHWLTGSAHTSSQATLTIGDFQRLTPFYNDRELYESVSVVSYPRETTIADTLWESDVVYIIPAGETVLIEAVLDNPAFSKDTVTYDAVNSGGVDMSASITMNPTDWAARVSMSFVNGHATQAIEIHNLTITGSPITSLDDVSVVEESSDGFWTDREGRDRKLTGNPWIQTQAQLSFLSEFLLDRMETPRLFFKIDGVRGDPQRRLGDRITVSDASMSISSRIMFLTAIDWRFERGGPFLQNYEAVDGTALYQYLTTDPSYFILGTNKLGAADPDNGRVFY